MYPACGRNRWGDDLSVITRCRNLSATSGPVDMDVLVSLKRGILLSGEDAEGMGTEVIALSLEDVGRDDLTPVTVQEGEGRRESRSRNTPENSLSDDTPPARVCQADS